MVSRLRFNDKDSTKLEKPNWIKVKSTGIGDFNEVRDNLKAKNLHTVCEEAACPNIGECWRKKHATVMILGDICTRACAFCNVKTGKPEALDMNEPEKVGELAAVMGLNHIVITSVDRDDLDDGGADHFVKVIKKVRELSPKTTIEVLTPDFKGKKGALEKVVEASPDVFNHNLETVARLHKLIKPKANYFYSLNLLWRVKQINPSIFTKSGLIVGLGEDNKEVIQAMDDMRNAEVDFLTIGQYLAPTPYHIAVDRYVIVEDFNMFKEKALRKGFLLVSSSPLTRSSYHADSDFLKLKENYKKQNG